MEKLNLKTVWSVLAFFAMVGFFFSCGKNETNDYTPPTSEVINSPNVPRLPYNQGGGCISTNTRCWGTCSASDWRKQGDCPDEYGCVRIMNIYGEYRFECWHFGPIWSIYKDSNNISFGIDVSSQNLSQCEYYAIKRIIDGVEETINTHISYTSGDNTIVYLDEDLSEDDNFTSLIYQIEFFDSQNNLLFAYTYQY